MIPETYINPEYLSGELMDISSDHRIKKKKESKPIKKRENTKLFDIFNE